MPFKVELWGHLRGRQVAGERHVGKRPAGEWKAAGVRPGPGMGRGCASNQLQAAAAACLTVKWHKAIGMQCA